MMPRQFERIDIGWILSDEFQAEAERRRRSGIARLGWEEEWVGIPVYKTGREIIELMA